VQEVVCGGEHGLLLRDDRTEGVVSLKRLTRDPSG
jgi:hypothetical protein